MSPTEQTLGIDMMNIIEFTGEKPYPDGIFTWNGGIYLSESEKNAPIAKGDLIIYGREHKNPTGFTIVQREVVRKNTLTHEAITKLTIPRCVYPNTEVKKDYPKEEKKKKSLADEMNELANKFFKTKHVEAKETILKYIKNRACYGFTSLTTEIDSSYYSIIDELIAEDFNVSSYKVAGSGKLKVNISWGDTNKEAADAS